ncbi:MAG: redoxin domain-containing protein, partial [bacterium]
MKRNAILSLCVLIFVSGFMLSLQADEPMIGKAAPDFTLIDSYAKKHSLSDYKGKFVVLEWFNPDCPFVKKHYGSENMQKLQKKYTKKGVIWLLINSSAAGKQGHCPPALANKIV